MTRIKQFANDMGLSYNQAKNLVNKGRKKRDGGSNILEKTMGAVKAKKGKSMNKKGKSMKLPKKKPKNFRKIVEDQRLARGEITIGDLNEANTNPKDFMPDKMLQKQTGGTMRKPRKGEKSMIKKSQARKDLEKFMTQMDMIPINLHKNLVKKKKDGGIANDAYFRDFSDRDKFIKQMQKQSKGPAKREKTKKKAKSSGSKEGFKDMPMRADGGSFGMLSVKAGIDNNPNPTQADRIAGATMKDKKEVKKMGGGMYDMTPRRMNKGGVARGMGAAVKGTGFKGVY